MSNQFFEKPILNSPYACPTQHWQLDETGQPTQEVSSTRRPAQYITPIPRAKKQSGAAQKAIVFDEGKGISREGNVYDPNPIINELRRRVALWRSNPNPNDWSVTPETARLLQHWRHHKFGGVRPFFCQVEAVETAIWLLEVAPNMAAGRVFLDPLARANMDANPDLMRFALKLATGAGKTTVMAMIIAWQSGKIDSRKAAKTQRKSQDKKIE